MHFMQMDFPFLLEQMDESITLCIKLSHCIPCLLLQPLSTSMIHFSFLPRGGNALLSVVFSPHHISPSNSAHHLTNSHSPSEPAVDSHGETAGGAVHIFISWFKLMAPFGVEN